MKAWMIVNKDFEANIKNYPNLFSGDLYFTKEKADAEMKERHPMYCGECGKKNKKVEVYIKVIPLEIEFAPEKTKKNP